MSAQSTLDFPLTVRGMHVALPALVGTEFDQAQSSGRLPKLGQGGLEVANYGS